TPGGLEIPFAVNVPTSSPDQKGSESDLTRTDENKLKEGYPGWTFQIVRDVYLAVLGQGGNPDAQDMPVPVGPFRANIALLMVLGLLFLEIVLAWHFGHYTTTEGAVAQAPPSPWATSIATILAIVSMILFGIGAVLLIHERFTGDFLG